MKKMNSSMLFYETLTLFSDKLHSLSFSKNEVDTVLDMAALLSFRTRWKENRPTIIGFIGCTGTGKSTLFNSLCGKKICDIGWKAHNTAGPVLLSSEGFFQQLNHMERDFAPLFFPGWKRESLSFEEVSLEHGHPQQLRWIRCADSTWNQSIMFDLPDINTTRAIQENRVAYQLQSWLDTVIFVVDEETLYHRDYEHPVAVAKELQQRRLCVINNRGQDTIDLDHPDLKDVRAFFGVDTIHVLHPLGKQEIFTGEPAFQRFRDDVLNTSTHAPLEPLEKTMAPLASRLIEENQRRLQVFSELEDRIEQMIHQRLSHEKPVPIHQILNKDANHILEHLGFKRFSLSNLLNFMKQITTSGAVRKSFKLAFGNRSQGDITHLLHLDREKLEEVLLARISDHREALRHAVLSHPDSDFLTDLFSSFLFNPEKIDHALQQQIKDAAASFEQDCQDLISSDTLKNSIKNDPMLAVAVLAVFVADVMTIPGFGSWVIVPSVFKYIPLGKFEKTKRAFQQRLRDIIRVALLADLHRLQSKRRETSLDTNDPLFHALKECAEYHEN